MKTGTNARTILTHLFTHGPTTRVALLNIVRPARRSPTWGNSFFLPTLQSGNGAGASLVARGLIAKVGIQGRRGVYAITSKGAAALCKVATE